MSGNIYSVNLSGARPLASSPDALVVLNGALDVIISSANSISPTFSIQGQVKVPLLYVTLDSASNFTSTNVKILNEFASFSPTSLGVSKIWLYRDSNSNQILDTSDTLLGTQSNPTDIATASITSVPIFSGRNDLIILYDIGANSPTGSSGVANARAQLSSVSSEGNLKFGGQSLPFPTTAASTLILDRRLTLSKIILGNPSGETYPTTFEVGMKLSNTTTGNVILTDAQPRFYIGSISGADISYEFTSTPEFSLPFTVTQNSETIVTFNVTRSTPVTDGTAVIDGFVDYVVPDSIYPIAVTPGIAELIRYRGANGWVPASSETSAVQIQASSSQYYWTVPAYIKSMEILVNGSTLPFANFDSIPKQTQLTLKFVNSGQNVDENSIKVFLNGILLTRKAVVSSGLSAIRPAATTGNYSFDASTGTLIVDDMGSTTGSLVVTLSDLEGNTLPTLALNFTISDRVKIENMYFFPNPYLRSASQPLVLGFGLTQPANLTVYLFNQVGNLVWTEKRRFSSVGYHTWETSFNQDFVTSGIYLCKMYAEDDNGNKSSAVTKLAIY
ncbi:hypothetical protein EBR96_02235 [bacterium]|nr:hypothetical protein [bacterium]